MSAHQATPFLRAKGLSKVYPPNVHALKGVDLDIRLGEVTALLGSNGAGKSTLARIMTGVERPTAGTLEIDGRAVVMSGPNDSYKFGVAAIYQELPLLPNLSAAENMSLGHTGKPLLSVWHSGPSRKTYTELAREVPNAPTADTLVGQLSVAQRQKVAFIRALSMQPQLLIVDEGTSSLSAEERQDMQDLLERLAHSRQMAVVYITHFIDDALACSDRIVALRDGELALDRAAAETTHADILEVLGGRVAGSEEPQRVEPADHRDATVSGDAVGAALHVENLRCEGVGAVTFGMKSGECLGVYGPPGCGATETLRAIAGLNEHTGRVRWNGEDLPKSTAQRARRNVVYCNGDRAKNLILSWTVARNIDLVYLFRQPMLSLSSAAKLRRRARDIVSRFDIKGSADEAIRNLSGGNQQRVAVARSLSLGAPLLLIGDDLTRGVDIVGRSHIHGLLRSAARDGAAILLYSSDPEEICALCDRVLVMRDGDILRELNGADVTVTSLEGEVQSKQRAYA